MIGKILNIAFNKRKPFIKVTQPSGDRSEEVLEALAAVETTYFLSKNNVNVQMPDGFQLIKEIGINKENITEQMYKNPDIFAFAKSTNADTNRIFATIMQNEHHSNHYIVSFRGTDTISDMIKNLEIQMMPFVPYKKSEKIPKSYADPAVHRGFFTLYKHMREAIWSTLENTSITHLTIAGHSLGGALGALLLYDIVSSQWDIVIQMYGFATPMVGGQEFVDNLDMMLTINPKYNIEIINNVHDLVPTIPPKILGYRPFNHSKKISFTHSQKMGKVKEAESIMLYHKLRHYIAVLETLYNKEVTMPEEIALEPIKLTGKFPPH